MPESYASKIDFWFVSNFVCILQLSKYFNRLVVVEDRFSSRVQVKE